MPPAAPVLAVNSVGTVSVSLRVVGAIPAGVNGIVIFYGTAPGGPYTNSVTQGLPGFIGDVSGLTPDTTYYFIAEFFSSPSTCTSLPSAEVNAHTHIAVPAAPNTFDLSDSSVAGNTILTWNNSDVPATNDIWKSTNGNPFVFLASVAGSVHTYTDATVMNSMDFFYYKIRATNGGGSSVYTAVKTASLDAFFAGSVATTLDFPTLVLAYGVFVFRDSPNLVSINTPILRKFYSDVNCQNCPALTGMSLPLLESFGGQVNFFNDTALSSFSIPGALYPNSFNVDMFGCALNAASVNQIIHRAAANPSGVSGSMNLTGGSSAAPTGQGIIDKNALNAAGYSINTN